MSYRIHRVCDEDLEELLPLVEDYLAFYEVTAERSRVRDLCAALLADPEREGVPYSCLRVMLREELWDSPRSIGPGRRRVLGVRRR